MNQTTSPLYPWQRPAFAKLQQLRGHWPHAILLHGPDGIGKSRFAEYLAQSLLCESVQADGQACGQCSSCGWFVGLSHPDYRVLRPEVFDAESAVAQAETNAPAESDAKSTSKSASKVKALSKEIVIDQVRRIADFMTISTHRQGMRVIVIYPAEAMNVNAANALLKSLEEPGPNTLFILVTSSPDTLLPTLVSRCHQFALALPDANLAMEWLLQQSVREPAQFLAEQGGSPLAALAASQSETKEQQQEFLHFLYQPSPDGALRMAEKCHKLPIPSILSWMQRWLYDVFSCKLAGKIRYYPRYQREITAIALKMSTSALLSLLDANTQRRAVADHPLSAKLVIEEMLLDYTELAKS